MEFTVVTWKDIENDCFHLAKKITDSQKKLDEIISITRGGMVAARILSDILGLPISHIALSSYTDLHQQKQPVVTQVSPQTFKGEAILLVDELVDSGKTFLAAWEYLRTLPVGEITTAVLYLKPHTVYTPDFFVKSHDSWIVLPYELRETKEALMKEFGEHEGMKKFSELKIRDWEGNH